jgi:hypothetical protein
MAIAQSDVGIELWASATGSAASFTKLVDVISIPATGSPQGKIEVTVLSSSKKQYIADREDLPDMEFGFNNTASNLTAVQAVCNIEDYNFLIVYGDGSGALIEGEANTWIDAVGRGQAVEGRLNIVPISIDLQTAVQVTALKTA